MNLPAPERLNLTYGVAVGRLGLDGKAGLVEILVLEVLPSAPWGPARRGRGPWEWVRTSRPLPPTPKRCLSPGGPLGKGLSGLQVCTRVKCHCHAGGFPSAYSSAPGAAVVPCLLGGQRSGLGQQDGCCSSATACTAHILFTSCLFSVQWLVLDFHNVSSFA